MKYYSTQLSSPKASFREALFSGLAPDGGLYMPETIPQRSIGSFSESISYDELAVQMISPFVGDEMNESELAEICEEAFSFSVPLVKLDEHFHILELFHGPTLAFKDFAARFMAKTMEHFMKQKAAKLTILVATSGDTGSAVANGFYKVDGINVIILYPSGRVSQLQEKQLTTLGENITALEVSGTFDDCQKLVKTAFLDKVLRSSKNLGSANSINIARLLPQSVYYVWAWLQAGKPEDLVISVPSGNFGNLTGGLIAKKMGLPVSQFIASVNANDVFPHYLQSGEFHPISGKRTISNAMDVGNPSNLVRINTLFSDDVKLIQKDIKSYSFNDEKTAESILRTMENYEYLPDPHTAVGISGLKRFTKSGKSNQTGIVLATAHPGKFSDIIEPIIDEKIKQPNRLKSCMEKEKQSIIISNSYSEFKQFLMSTN